MLTLPAFPSLRSLAGPRGQGAHAAAASGGPFLPHAAARLRCWKRVMDETERLADTFREVAETGRIMDVVEPL